MENVTFNDINKMGEIVSSNGMYKHVHYPAFLACYDCNFIEFHGNVTITEFMQIERYLIDFHKQKGQRHVKFYFPDNEKPNNNLKRYLKHSKYSVGWLELYAIKPRQFPLYDEDPSILVEAVSATTLSDYVRMQYKQDIQYGEDFAEQKRKKMLDQFFEPNVIQVMAWYKGIPAGYVDLFVTNKTVEIDNLMVEKMYRQKGIGSRLQKYVMDHFPNKTIILVADGEDTPRQMYQKQNYQFIGFKYEAFKLFEK